MSRSVATPYNAVKVAYAAFEPFDADEDDGYDPYLASEYFEDAVYNLIETARERYPSLEASSGWIDRENRVVLENALARVTVSEYNGLVAVAVVPKGDVNSYYTDEVRTANLAGRWCAKLDLSALAACFGTPLISRGYASNGEQFFTPAKKSENKGAMGLGFTSKEGWL